MIGEETKRVVIEIGVDKDNKLVSPLIIDNHEIFSLGLHKISGIMYWVVGLWEDKWES